MSDILELRRYSTRDLCEVLHRRSVSVGGTSQGDDDRCYDCPRRLDEDDLEAARSHWLGGNLRELLWTLEKALPHDFAGLTDRIAREGLR